MRRLRSISLTARLREESRRTMRLLFLIPVLAWAAWGQQAPVSCVAGARFHVGDLEKARAFYSKVFGLQEKIARAGIAAFQLNANQFVEFSSSGGDAANPLEIVYLCGDKKTPALKDPGGRYIELVTPQFRPSATGVSNHLLHVGMGVADMEQTIEFYGGHFLAKEIFRRLDGGVLIMRMPGPREDWVEFILKGQQGADHFCLDVPDIQKTYQTLLDRGAAMQGKPRVASNGHWVINVLDPNGIRVELMEPQVAVKAAASDIVYVAANGQDGATGSIDKPLASLAAARDRIRTLRAGGDKSVKTVILRGGTYRLPETFTLGPEDSDTTYAAYPGELPIISGGRAISRWKQQEKSRGGAIWTAPAPWEFHQLFLNGRRAQRSRLPHQGFFRGVGMSSQDRPFKLPYRGNEISPSWAGRGDIEVVVLLAWKEMRMPIARVDDANHVAVLTGNPSPGNPGRDPRFYIENAPEGLGPMEEGTENWRLDRETKTAYFWMPQGEDPGRDDVVAPALQQLVRIEGKPGTGQLVRRVTFRGLEFRHTDWTIPSNGYLSQQAAVTIPAAFEAVGAEEIAIEHCRFSQMGGYGIEFGRGTKRNRIIANEVFDMGADGIKVGLPIHVASAQSSQYPRIAAMLEDEGQASSSTVITDNEIHDLGLVFPSAVGIWIGQSDGNTVAHNHVHDLYFSGISVGWTWGYGPTRARNNIIEFNHIHNVGKDQMMSDMGGIYTLGVQPGTVIRNNLIHDVDRFTYGGWGLYSDEGSSKMIFENNIVYNCKSAPFNMNYSSEQTVRNNVFAFGTQYQMMRSPLVDTELPFTFERNIVYYDQGEVMAGVWAGKGLRMDRNIFWYTGGDGQPQLKRAWEEWRKLGQNGNSVIADPLFTAPDSYNFRLKPESPALKAGFQEIDLSSAGPRVHAGPGV